MTNETDLNAFWNTTQKSLLLPPAPEWDGKYQRQTHSYLSFGITHLTSAVDLSEINLIFPQPLDRKKHLKVKIFSVGVPSILTASRQRAFYLVEKRFHPSSPLWLDFQLFSCSCSLTCRDCNWCHKPAQQRTSTAEFIASSNDSRDFPTPPAKLITLTPIITADNEHSCEPNWSHWGAQDGIVPAGASQSSGSRGDNKWGSHFASKLAWQG